MPRLNPAPRTADPVMVPLPQAPLYFGLSRSALYRAAAGGSITMKKMGRTTLVDVASVRDYLDSLPTLAPTRHGNTVS